MEYHCHRRAAEQKATARGYPDGLQGNEIPLSARIVAVADVFDALTSVRCYKDSVGAEVARVAILDGSGKQFDPVVVRAFEGCFDEFQRIFDMLGAIHAEEVGV